MRMVKVKGIPNDEWVNLDAVTAASVSHSPATLNLSVSGRSGVQITDKAQIEELAKILGLEGLPPIPEPKP